MTRVPLLTVDAFTDRPFSGNPAAVVLLEQAAEPAWMQAVAAEMNLSETAFVAPRADGDHDLRWFTPTVEVDLCGHATLATAHALWSEGRATPGGVLRFQTRSGELRAGHRDDGRVELDLPVAPPVEGELAPELLRAVGVRPTRSAAVEDGWALVEVATAAEVRGARPDVVALAGLPPVILTAPGDGDHDVVSRVFAPGLGIPEDPVTGAAHCVLAPWWVPRLGRGTFRAAQVSARGGELEVRLDGERVRLAGHAVTVARGELLH